MEFKVNFEDVQFLDFSKDSDFIHRNIEGMLGFLGFRLELSRFQIISDERRVCVPSLADLKKIYPDIPNPKLFIRHQRYLRPPDIIASSTGHKTYKDILGSNCIDYCLIANSTIGLENKVIGLDKAKELFNACENISTILAFKMGYLVKVGLSYSIHPTFLYDLCLKKRNKN